MTDRRARLDGGTRPRTVRRGLITVELVRAVLVAPFADMAANPTFLAEVLIGGIAAGLMYSLVALGFVLIFKASGVFNFAQGVMVLFAALTLVGLMERGVPVWLALGLTMAVMVVLAFAIERVVLRPLVNQEPIILFMATIGLDFLPRRASARWPGAPTSRGSTSASPTPRSTSGASW